MYYSTLYCSGSAEKENTEINCSDKGGGRLYSVHSPSTCYRITIEAAGGRLHTASTFYRITTEAAGGLAAHGLLLLQDNNRGCWGAGYTQPLPSTG